MAGVNKVILVGHLGKNPETKVLNGDVKVCSFSLATSESYKDRNTGERVTQTEWHNVVLWKSLAEIAEKYLTKGSQVYIEGKLQTRSYQDKDGVTKYSTQIIGQNLTMLSSNSGSSQSMPREPEQSETYSPNNEFNNMSESDIDDLPF